MLSLVHLLFGLGLCDGFLAADGGEYGPYLIGVTCGVMLVLLAICVQMMKGVRIGGRPRSQPDSADGWGRWDRDQAEAWARDMWRVDARVLRRDALPVRGTRLP